MYKTTRRRRYNRPYDDYPTPTVSSPRPRPTKTPTPKAPSIPDGTLPSGENPNDSKFDKAAHHIDFSEAPPSDETRKHRSYRVMYDPELDSRLSKQERKSASKKVRFNGEGVSRDSVVDPRKSNIAHYFQKPNKMSKKFPFKQLPQAKWAFDKDSLGPPPQTEVVVWDLPSSVSEVYLSNFFRSFGDAIKEMKFWNDPINAVPLGVATFRFQGSAEKAMGSAKRLIAQVKQENTKIDGAPLKIGLNDHEGELLERKVNSAVERLRQIKRTLEEEERRRERKREEERKEREERERKEKEKEERERKERERERERGKEKEQDLFFAPNTTTVIVKKKRKVIDGVFLPKELARYVKERPYVLIRDKYVSTRRIPSQDIKRLFNKYAWTRVLADKTGFYIVFNSLQECDKLFRREDGRRFYDFRMYMELCVPPGYDCGETDFQSKTASSAVDEAMNILLKDFQVFLSRDIHERVIAPKILDLLSHDNYPELAKELKAKEAANKEAAAQRLKNVAKQDAMSLLAKQRQQSSLLFKMNSFRNTKRERKNIPMQHALNYSSSEEEDEEEEEEETPERIEKRPFEEEEEADEVKRQKHESDVEIDYSKLDAKYQPTPKQPMMVYPEPSVRVLDLNGLQSIVKDDEDLRFAQLALRDVVPAAHKNLEYWAWKQKSVSGETHEVEQLDPRLDSSTGSFRSEGYRKIPDPDKILYLPHRRKADPIKTVQHDVDDDDIEDTPDKETTVQSSRVNRANNRRFAADITAQLGTETEALSLNALTKRKKPVTFARSAIHNWGLYALEPIAAKEMIIEYVGESIRQQVSENRERSYLKTGIGSSYLFRVDENTVIDATKKGGIARFINHCCDPSCTAKIIKVEGKKRIVIYALKDIEANEELTYDYKFERETNDAERIRCLCGAKGCKGYLN